MKKPLVLFATLALLSLAVAIVPQRVGAVEDKVVLASDGTIFLISGGERRGFSSPAIFFSRGFRFSDAMPASVADLAVPEGAAMTYRDGALVKGSSPTVYLVSGGQKHPFVSAEAFLGHGYSFANVLSDLGALSTMAEGGAIDSPSSAHMPGALINYQGTVFVVTANGRRGISTLDAFYAERFRLEEVVPANPADLALPEETSVPVPTPEPPPSDTGNHAPTAPVIGGVIASFPSEGRDFSFSASDQDNDSLIYLINWGDGSPTESTVQPSGASFTRNHGWIFLGDYSITVTASDPSGASAVAVYSIKIGTDPTVFGPAITLLTPNGGEAYLKSQTIKISWKRNWYPAQSQGKVDINYIRGGGNGGVATNISDSAYTWIPENLVTGDNYKIAIISHGSSGGGAIVVDQSDSTFTLNP